MAPFIPHFIDGSFYSCSGEELTVHIDEIFEFIDSHETAVIFVAENDKPSLVLMGTKEYEKRKLGTVDFHDKVELVPHQAVWEERYKEEAASLKSALGDIPCTISHIGSTAVDGMPSKPILDMLITVPDTGYIPDAIDRLSEQGYSNLGECGRDGRFFLSKGNKPNETFYAHLTTPDNPVAQDQLLFTKLLHSSPAIRKAYKALKQELAEAYPTNRPMYRKQKACFIEGVLLGYRNGGGNENTSGNIIEVTKY